MSKCIRLSREKGIFASSPRACSQEQNGPSHGCCGQVQVKKPHLGLLTLGCKGIVQIIRRSIISRKTNVCSKDTLFLSVGEEKSLQNIESLKIVHGYRKTNVWVIYDIHFDAFT